MDVASSRETGRPFTAGAGLLSPGWRARAWSGGLGRSRIAFAAIALVLAARPASADPDPPAPPTSEDLAREDQNPITRFYVARFEDNVQLGFGPERETLNFFRLQPLVPIRLSADWTLLTRTIVPIVHVPWPESTDGLGDVSLITFLTPAHGSEGFVWGLGPAFLLPTATDELLGTEKWSAGPAAAVAYTKGPWVAGAIVQNLWSFAGDGDRADVRTMTLRPLLNYNLPRGWYLTTSPSIVANWDAKAEDRWLVPLGGGVGRVYQLGPLRMSTTLESYYHVASPAIGPEWQIRLQHSFLYPD